MVAMGLGAHWLLLLDRLSSTHVSPRPRPLRPPLLLCLRYPRGHICGGACGPHRTSLGCNLYNKIMRNITAGHFQRRLQVCQGVPLMPSEFGGAKESVASCNVHVIGTSCIEGEIDIRACAVSSPPWCSHEIVQSVFLVTMLLAFACRYCYSSPTAYRQRAAYVPQPCFTLLPLQQSAASSLHTRRVGFNPSFRYVDDRSPLVPFIIHHIWLGSPLPEELARLRESWLSRHAHTSSKHAGPSQDGGGNFCGEGAGEWEVRLWTDADVEAFGLENKEAYDAAGNFGQKSDILRYEVKM